jgi:nondiscriminating glutamyl-tRNA synthetase
MVRVRFAPSPTGNLHVGNARTAIVNFLFAREKNGSFLLRIEDTDLERSQKGHEESILEDLSWLGIEWNEGPFRQSDRTGIYQAFSERLLAADAAYRCFCPRDRLDAMRKDQVARGEPPRYDGRCRNLPKSDVERFLREGHPYVIRFKAPDLALTVNDLIHGSVTFPASHAEDFILLKQDGMASYNFAAAVDDLDMGITHVIRGSDHLSNTPKQIRIFEALGGRPPVYGHLGLMTGKDGKPLSKRHGETTVKGFQNLGILPSAMTNYLAAMGRKMERELLTMDELVTTFSLTSLSPADGVFDLDKLLWFNREHLKLLSTGDMAHLLGLGPESEPFLAAVRENAGTLAELKELLEMFTGDAVKEEAMERLTKIADADLILHRIEEVITENPDRSAGEVIEALKKGSPFPARDLLPALRIVVTGRTSGPPLMELFPLVPKGCIIGRLQWIEQRYSRH